MHEQIAKGNVENGRIRGYVPHGAARGLNPNLDVELISHVEGGLWQGGCEQGIRLPHDFDFVLSLYPWEQYTLGPSTERVEVKMYDSLDQAFDQVDELAHDVVKRLSADQKVLVHCQAGLNRSGLLAARILTLQGWTPAAAIAKLRQSRCELVLCNEAFENWIAGCVPESDA